MLNWLKRKFTKSEDPEAKTETKPEVEAVQINTLDQCVQLKEQGNRFLAVGQLQDAEKCYRQAISIDPNYAHAHNNLSHVFKQQGLIEEAKKSAQTALLINPNLFEARYQLGTLARDQGEMEDALKYFNSALEIKPDFEMIYDDLFSIHFKKNDFLEAQKIITVALNNSPENAKFHYNSGLLFARQNDFKKAISCLQQALKFDCENTDIILLLARVFESDGDTTSAITQLEHLCRLHPDSPEIYTQLGSYYFRQNQIPSAITSFETALQLKPDSFEILDQLAPAYIQDKRLADAINCYEKILFKQPNLAQIYYNLGLLQRDIKILDKAELSFRTAIQIKSDFALAYCYLSDVLSLKGEFSAAEYNAEKALEIDDKLAFAHFYLGNARHALLKPDNAIQSYQNAIEINPDFTEAYCNIGVIHFESGNMDSAIAYFRRTLECDPSYLRAIQNLGSIVSIYDPQASLPYFRKLIQLKPDNDIYYTSLLFSLLHCENISSENLFLEHCSFGKQFESPDRWPEHHNTREPSRRLKIGFVSGDFYKHAVMNFFEPILKYLAQYSDLILHAYNNTSESDDVSRRLRKYFTHWHDIVPLSHDQLAKKIMSDGIDILIDLSGHTMRNRLLTFAMKPAPVQISWMGYPATTGLQAMDYYFADKLFLPGGLCDTQFTEKLVYLPSTVDFLQQKDNPEVTQLPALVNGFITFGSFNRLKKLNRSVIALWAQLLRALPTSRLLLGGMPRQGTPNPVIGWLENEGITKDRISFYPHSDMVSYLNLHNKVDICLDTFPYGGGTTTSHALMMGVPTLTLAGTTPASRHGVSIMGAVNLADFIATEKDDFVKKGVAWSNNLSELANIREGMRNRCASIPKRHPEQIAARVRCAFRIMWQRWCDGSPVVTFDSEIGDSIEDK